MPGGPGRRATSLLAGDIYTGQGSQYALVNFLQPLIDRNIKVSMDLKGRALGNIFVERLRRTIKCEEVYIREYPSIKEAHSSLKRFIKFYKSERLHQSLTYIPSWQREDTRIVLNAIF